MENLLREGLRALGLPAEAASALAEYARRLEEKNQVMNLTAITDPAQVAALHFLDSAALLTLTDLRRTWSGSTAGPRTSPPGGGRHLTWPPAGPWPPCPY